MNPTSSDEKRISDSLELPLNRFGVRSQTVLRYLNITTVGEFLNVDWDTVVCWQLGAGTRAQLLQIHEDLSRDPEEWMQQSREDLELATPFIVVEWPEDIVEASLPVHNLSLRARNVLWQNGLTTLGAFLNFDWEHAFARQLGAKTRAELLQWRSEMGQTPEEVRAWEAQLPAKTSLAAQNHLPEKLPLLETPTGLLDWPRVWPLVVKEGLNAESRSYEILKRRFGLDGAAIYSLTDLGLNLGVSRERVRQVEAAALLQLRKLLVGQALRGSKLQLHPRALEEQSALRQLFEEMGFPVAETEVWEWLRQRYMASLSDAEKASFRLLLELWGFADFSPAPPDVPQKIGRLWLETWRDREFVGVVLRSIAQNLRGRVEPVSLFDLQIEVNRTLKEEKIERHCDEVALRRLVALWPRAEEVAPDLFQTRWEFLPSNPTRAERIFREWASAGTLRATLSVLCEETNHRYALAGRDDTVTQHAMSGACSTSPHLTNISRSGQWTLIENAGETRSVHEIIKEALLQLNRPAALEELTEYVAQRRETAPNTVACLISQHPHFQRVGRGVYALRSWGLQDAAPVRRGEEYQREFEDLLLEIFFENDLEPINHAKLANRLQMGLGWPLNTIRTRIERSPYIETTSINGFHLMAHLRDKPEVEAEKPER